jgi:hypothetical protein
MGASFVKTNSERVDPVRGHRRAVQKKDQRHPVIEAGDQSPVLPERE